MRKILCLMSSFSLLALLGCPSGPSTPTTGEGFFIYTGAEFYGFTYPAEGTTVSGVWLADGTNPTGSTADFFVTTDDFAEIGVVNARVPATWVFEWIASQSYPACDGLGGVGTVSAPGNTEDIICLNGEVEGEESTFHFIPGTIILPNAPNTVTLSTGGIALNSQYGMPVAQYFNTQGTLVAQATAISVSANGQSAVFPTGNLSSVAAADYAGFVSTENVNGTYSLAGAAAVQVREPKPPPPCKGQCTTIRSGGEK